MAFREEGTCLSGRGDGAFSANTLCELRLVAANKIVKTHKEEIEASLRELRCRISDLHPLPVASLVFPVSEKTGERLRALKGEIGHLAVCRR